MLRRAASLRQAWFKILCRASRRAPSASTRSRAPSLCLAVNTGRQRKPDPDLFRLRKHRLCQRRLMAAIERRHLDLASIGAADSQSSAPAAAQSMYWSSSKSAMVRLLGSTRTWARTVNGTLIQASARRTVGLGASGPLGKLAKTLTFGLPFPVILSIAEAADQNGRQLSRSWSKPGCLRFAGTRPGLLLA